MQSSLFTSFRELKLHTADKVNQEKTTSGCLNKTDIFPLLQHTFSGGGVTTLLISNTICIFNILETTTTSGTPAYKLRRSHTGDR